MPCIVLRKGCGGVGEESERLQTDICTQREQKSGRTGTGSRLELSVAIDYLGRRLQLQTDSACSPVAPLCNIKKRITNRQPQKEIDKKLPIYNQSPLKTCLTRSSSSKFPLSTEKVGNYLDVLHFQRLTSSSLHTGKFIYFA